MKKLFDTNFNKLALILQKYNFYITLNMIIINTDLHRNDKYNIKRNIIIIYVNKKIVSIKKSVYFTSLNQNRYVF